MPAVGRGRYSSALELIVGSWCHPLVPLSFLSSTMPFFQKTTPPNGVSLLDARRPGTIISSTDRSQHGLVLIASGWYNGVPTHFCVIFSQTSEFLREKYLQIICKSTTYFQASSRGAQSQDPSSSLIADCGQNGQAVMSRITAVLTGLQLGTRMLELLELVAVHFHNFINVNDRKVIVLRQNVLPEVAFVPANRLATPSSSTPLR